MKFQLYVLRRKIERYFKHIFSSQNLEVTTPLNQVQMNDKIQRERVLPWFKDLGDQTLRLDYDLDETSVVFSPWPRHRKLPNPFEVGYRQRQLIQTPESLW